MLSARAHALRAITHVRRGIECQPAISKSVKSIVNSSLIQDTVGCHAIRSIVLHPTLACVNK